jgi:hypothetical protein
MESTMTQVALYVVAVWTWVWLMRVVRHDIPVAIYLQQSLGVKTCWQLYRLAERDRWLAACGLAVAVAAWLAPEMRVPVAIGMLAVAVGLLTAVHAGVARLLNPRLVKSVLASLHGDKPDEPRPAG